MNIEEKRQKRSILEYFLTGNKYEKIAKNQQIISTNFNLLKHNEKSLYVSSRKLHADLLKLNINEKNLKNSILVNNANVQSVSAASKIYHLWQQIEMYKNSRLNREYHIKSSLETIHLELESLVDRIYSKFQSGNCFRYENKLICSRENPNVFLHAGNILIEFPADIFEVKHQSHFQCLIVNNMISKIHNGNTLPKCT